jgi:hypothetical protein
MKVLPMLAVVVTALGLYVSQAVLDQITTSDGPVRVALLPPWQSFVGFLAVGALGLLWLDRRAAPRRTATAVRPQLGPLVLPLFALLLLALPYLPVIPDVIPAVQILAGPVRYVVWLVVATQVVWTMWQVRLVGAEWLQRLSVVQGAIAIGVATICISGAAAVRLVDTVLYPGGDEPHYLVIAQSLWRDGDLAIENNHTRGDYREYYKLDLAPHYLTRGSDGEIYSIQPVGMPTLIAPVYGAGGYHGVVGAFVLMAALAASVMWWSTTRLTNHLGAATFGWAAVVATSPFLFNSFAIYPEIPAALAVAVAFTLATVAVSPSPLRWVGIGLACAALPWLSTKYAPMSAALVAVAMARALWPAQRQSVVQVASVVLPYALSLAAWFYFFNAYWGVPLPQAPYGALVQTDLRYLIFGGPGLLFDQEYGLLPYAPVYVFAATGFVAMWHADLASRRRAVEIVLVFGALLGTVGAFRIWWGGSASPGRPLASGLLLLMVPVAFAFRAAAAGTASRAAQHVLLWCSVGIAGILLYAQQGLLTANGRDGTSMLLEYLSPRWPAWTVAPSFIHHEAVTAIVHSLAWIALATSAAFLLTRVRNTRPGAASLAAMAVTAGALLLASVVMPLLPLSPAWPGLDLRARARLPVLDEFDTVARPIAVEYSPLRFISAAEAITHVSVAVEPGLRTQPQPIRVLLNGRFSLPAGRYRIEIDWTGRRQGEEIGLQIGRTGDPVERWAVEAEPGQRWEHTFVIPVDAPFVGLRGTPELERVIGMLRIIPETVEDAASRPRGPAVIAAARSGPATLYFYDTYASPEDGGFWVWGGQRTQVMVAHPGEEGPIVLRVHSGPIGNRLHITTFGWRHSVELSPNSPQTIEVPADSGTVITLEFAADSAFVPRTLDPASTDARTLGVWVEVLK